MTPRTLLQPFMPPIETARHYNLYKLRKDLIAGLTVSVVEVPQAMAYAIIAGVPPVYGLYTSIIQGFIGALLSSSEHMTTGPTNTQSLLIASAVHRLVDPDADPARYLELVFCLTLLKGLIQLTFAAARMGDMVRYVSRSVIAGLVSGAGLLIFFGQLPVFLGITGRDPDEWPGIVGPIQRLLHHLHDLRPVSIWVGLGALLVVITVRRISKLLPGALIAVVLSALLVWGMGLGSDKLPLVNSLPPSVPSFHAPRITWALSEQLFGGALALAMIGMLESVAIAKSIAAHTGEPISANQEFFAQGLKNSLSSFWQCIPGSGSFTRSALDYAAGAQTRFAAVFNAIFVAVLFFLLGNQARYIPRAALAAVLFVIAYGLVDWRHVLRLARTSRADTVVCIVTFLATLMAPLEYAIFIGVFLNIGLYLRRASRLHLHEMVEAPGGRFIETPLQDRSGQRQVVFLQAEGDLFFAVADELSDRLTALARSPGVRVVVLRLKRTHSVDSTVLAVLEQFVKQMRERDGHVLVCGVRPELLRVLNGYGLTSLIGPPNVFEAGPGVFESARRALDRAKDLVGASIDAADIEEAEERALVYEI